MHDPPAADGTTPSRSFLPPWHDRALVLAFMASLAAPHVASVCGLSRPFDPEVEKRAAVEFPSIEWRGSGWRRRPRTADLFRFPARLEDYLLDRTGFRQEGVAAVGRARLAGWLPGESVASCMPARLRAEPATHCAVRGADGWCFYLSAAQIAEMAGRGGWTEDRVADTWRRSEERRAWLAAHGIAYVVVVAPNKESIYPEHLPPWAGGPPGRTPLDLLVEHVGRVGGPRLVDLRPELLAAKARGRTYHAADTHWNSFGALVGCRAVLRECAPLCPGLTPPPLDGYASRPDVMVGGDLARMLGTPRSEERVEVFEWRGGEARAGREAPRVFLLGDSFTGGMRPHLDRWCTVAGVGRHDEFPAEAILAARPQIVIHEFVERHLPDMGFTNPAAVVRTAGLAAAHRAAVGPR